MKAKSTQEAKTKQLLEAGKRQAEISRRAEAAKAKPKAAPVDVVGAAQKAVEGKPGAPAQKILMTKGQTTEAAQAAKRLAQQAPQAAKPAQQAITTTTKKAPGFFKGKGKLLAIPAALGTAAAGAYGLKKYLESREGHRKAASA